MDDAGAAAAGTACEERVMGSEMRRGFAALEELELATGVVPPEEGLLSLVKLVLDAVSSADIKQ